MGMSIKEFDLAKAYVEMCDSMSTPAYRATSVGGSMEFLAPSEIDDPVEKFVFTRCPTENGSWAYKVMSMLDGKVVCSSKEFNIPHENDPAMKNALLDAMKRADTVFTARWTARRKL